MYEPLPYGDVKTRPQRCSMLTKALLDRGHTVELWTSSFDHVFHKHRHAGSISEKIGDRLSIQFVQGCGYPHDLSPKRFLHNRQTAKEFSRLAEARADTPDIIFAPVPILELAQAAVNYANERNIPVIVDLLDLWPDVYLTALPKWLRPIGKRLLYFEYRRARQVFKKAVGITSISNSYLNKALSYAQRERQNTDRVFPLGSVGPVGMKPEDSEIMSASILQKYGIDHNHFIVTYVGTFSKFLDIQNILNAAPLLASIRNIRIFIIGTGERSKEFFKIAARLPNVTMTGWLDSAAIQKILNLTNVGLAAYSKDAIMSLPNKPFEYMAAGLPLLSSLPGELERLIQENDIGRKYEAGNPESLAEEIQWFFNHPEETRQMGKRSLNLFKTRFQSDIVYTNFSEYLEEIAANHA